MPVNRHTGHTEAPRNANIEDIFKGKLMTFEDIDKMNI
jgi:hypothetical protein